MLSTTQSNTIYAADSILRAKPAHLEIELRDYPACLLELVEVCIEHLEEILSPGVGGRIIELEILKRKVQKRLAGVQIEML